MSWKLVLTDGQSSLQEFSLVSDVIRVGSDPHCDVSLSEGGLPSHALTLQREGNSLRVHNRSDRMFPLGSSPLTPGVPASWEVGAALDLGNGRSLVLVEGQASPAPARSRYEDYSQQAGIDLSGPVPDTQVPGQETEFGTVDSTKQKKSEGGSSNTTSQLVVIGICLFVVVMALAKGGQKQAEVGSGLSRKVVTFKEVSESLLGREESQYRGILEQIRIAKRYELSGNREKATKEYRLALRQLLAQMEQNESGELASYRISLDEISGTGQLSEDDYDALLLGLEENLPESTDRLTLLYLLTKLSQS